MDLKRVYEEARQDVIGQDEALKKLILTVNHNLNDGYYNKENIILKGDRGSGKTFMCEIVAKCMNIPFMQIDASFADGKIRNFHFDEVLTSFVQQLESSELPGIILLNNFDKILSENKDNNIISLVKRNDYLLADSRLQIYGVFDLSGITFVAEGEYNDKLFGFNNKDNIMTDSLFSSRFTKIIETNPVTCDFVLSSVLFSNASSLAKLGSVTLEYDEIDKIVAMIMERKIGLHSAPAVIDEVLYPKLEKKYFS